MKRLRHLVDIILFNPPYVPTDTEEILSAQNDCGISGSWAGGADGMEITNRLLRDVEVMKIMMESSMSFIHVVRRIFCLNEVNFILSPWKKTIYRRFVRGCFVTIIC